MIEEVENLGGNISSVKNVDGSATERGKVSGFTLAAAEKHMTYITLSTDMNNPTDLMQYKDKSGTYVAKNKGYLGANGEVLTILNEGMFFQIRNLKDLYAIAGEILPDEDNIITAIIPSIEGYYENIFILTADGIGEAVSINSANIEDYMPDIDTSNLLDKTKNINSSYGIQLYNNFLAIYQATQSEINSGTTQYKPITPNNGDYFIENRGAKFFPTKEELETLQTSVNTLETNTNTLISEMETILDSVVIVNE